MIDKARAEEIIAEVRGVLGLSQTDTINIMVLTDSLATVQRFGAEHSEWVHAHEPGELIYARRPISSVEANVSAQTDVTAANLDQLPTPGLRQRARELLGLAATEEVRA